MLYGIVCASQLFNIIFGAIRASEAKDHLTRISEINNILGSVATFPIFLYFARLILKEEPVRNIEKKEEISRESSMNQKNEIRINTNNSTNFFSIKTNNSNEELVNMSRSSSGSPPSNFLE